MAFLLPGYTTDRGWQGDCYARVYKYIININAKSIEVFINIYKDAEARDSGMLPVEQHKHTLRDEYFDIIHNRGGDDPNMALEEVYEGLYQSDTFWEENNADNVFEVLEKEHPDLGDKGDEINREDAVEKELIQQPDVDVLFKINGDTLEYTTNPDRDIQIGGFQLGINQEGLVPISGDDTESANAGFMVSAGANAVIGFSFTGSVLPPGEDMIMLKFVDSESNPIMPLPDALEIQVISDFMGNEISAAWYITDADFKSHKLKKEKE